VHNVWVFVKTAPPIGPSFKRLMRAVIKAWDAGWIARWVVKSSALDPHTRRDGSRATKHTFFPRRSECTRKVTLAPVEFLDKYNERSFFIDSLNS
jgi:hypothetical protein